MRAYVLARDTLAILGPLEDSLGQLVIHRRMWEPDSFSLTANRRKIYASHLPGNLLLVPEGTPTDPSAGDQLIFLVEAVEIDQQGSVANDTMTVGGRSIEGLPRRCDPTAGQAYDSQSTVHAETAMKHYVTANLSATATVAARRIAGLTCAADAARGSVNSWAARYQLLADYLAAIGQDGGLGWKTTLAKTLGIPSGFTFDVIAGTDRSASVFFDFDFETLSGWTELTNIGAVVSQVVVAGQGEGVLREIVSRPVVEPTGFDRRESFVDARDVAVGGTTLLRSRGDAVLAANAAQVSLEATVHQYGSFVYGRDWFMGDTVLVRNLERGLSYSIQVVGIDKTVTTSDAAAEIVAVLGRPFPGETSATVGAGGAADKGMTPGPGTVTYAMIQNVSATARLLGRNSAGAGSIEELTAAVVRTMLGLGTGYAEAALSNGLALTPTSVNIAGVGLVYPMSGGTAFPTGAALTAYGTFRPYWRSDLGMSFYHDGTNWLHTALTALPLKDADAATGTVYGAAAIPTQYCTNFWIESLQVAIKVAATHDAANYWDVTAYDEGTGAIGTSETSWHIVAAAATWGRYLIPVGVLSGTGAGDVSGGYRVSKHGSPGALTSFRATLLGRIVGS